MNAPCYPYAAEATYARYINAAQGRDLAHEATTQALWQGTALEIIEALDSRVASLTGATKAEAQGVLYRLDEAISEAAAVLVGV